ncbi:MAG: hypothetical protein Q8L71_11980 [Thiobacillus sp.]|nr:hypothetical protein [Thiobacillus sp.]
MEKIQTQVLTRARCIRLAFFVDLDEASHPILDAIFGYSFSIWGGRFSLIVPCANGEPLPAYMPWLASFDPDLIYSYVDLTSEKQQELHETVYPSALQHHWSGRDNEHVIYRPSPSIPPLAVGTLLPLAGAPGAIDGTRGVQLVGSMGRMESDRFLADSFGFASAELRNSMRTVLADFGSMLLVVADDELQPRQRYIHDAEATVSDISALLTKMTANRRILGVAQLSAQLTPRLDLRSHRWSNSFNIVVGDTVADRILYWNARALMPPWRDGGDVDICIPRAKFDDPVFVEALRGFLNRRNYVNGGGGNGPYSATLRSVSLSAEELAPLAEQMRQGQIWIMFSYEHVASVTECVPEARTIEDALFTVGTHGFRSPNLWSEFFSVGNELRPTSLQPEHMRHVPSPLISPSSGAWAVDLDIERTVDHSPYSNVRHRWRLPRRLRVTQAFRPHYQLTEPHGEVVGPRVSAGGLLTLFTVANATLPKITLPADYDAIVVALKRGRDWPPFERFGNRLTLPQLCHEARRSNAGRYFWGVYQLFGDINMARSVLLHEFWRKQLEDYGATDQRTDVRQDRMKVKLLRRIGTRPLDLANADQLDTLSDIVLQESDAERMTVRSLDWRKFETDFKALAGRFDAAHPPPQGGKHDPAEEDRWRIGSLRESVSNLCNLGVLHQGYEHKCRKCLHRSWIAIADLRPDIVCEVCHDVQPAPVDRAWQFRLNGFLREALQRYGIGPLFWVLSQFQRHSTDSFWFEGPLDIFFDQDAAEAGRQETDIDLTMIDDGIVRMCEVKQSERQFKDPARLAQTMAKLRPDIAMIAVMEADSPALRRKFEEFSAALTGTGIKPELFTLGATNDISADPYF